MLEGMVTEKELLKLMDLKLSELAYLRTEKGMPYVRLSSRKRVYLESDLIDWFKKNRQQEPTGIGKTVVGTNRGKQALTGDDNADDTDV